MICLLTELNTNLLPYITSEETCKSSTLLNPNTILVFLSAGKYQLSRGSVRLQRPLHTQGLPGLHNSRATRNSHAFVRLQHYSKFLHSLIILSHTSLFFPGSSSYLNSLCSLNHKPSDINLTGGLRYL